MSEAQEPNKTEEGQSRLTVGLGAETSTVRRNLMSQRGYTPYCGNVKCFGMMPRTRFNGEQFSCPSCQWVSEFPADFIARYKAHWAEAPNADITG